MFFLLSRYDGMATAIFMIKLSTRDVEKIVAHVFDVPDTDKLALRARLENLRKKGCPHGLATGRGKVAKFDFEQLSGVSIALALIDAGLSPDYAVLAVEDTDGVVRECFGLLALHDLPTNELRAALDEEEWPVGRTVTAWCCMHRLLSTPRDDAVRVATWIASDSTGNEQSAEVPFSAVRIDVGALFVRLVKALSQVADLDVVEVAQALLAQAEEYVVSS
jgi:hypothetical protein